MDLSKVFKDLIVIELASVLAGPAVGMFFAEMGATVIKVENATTQGDVTRRWKLPSEAAEEISAYYASVNWNKIVHLIDLTQAEGQNEVQTLIKTADIVISNYSPEATEQFGMDYETLKRLNPRLIFGQITAFGPNNPRLGFDVVLQAEAGFLFMNGEPNGNPVKMPVALIDILAAHQLKEGLLVGLYQRLKTGRGSFVTVSLFDAAVASLANQATNWLMAGHIPQPLGTLHPNIAPYGEVFRTKEGKPIVLAIGTERQFKQLCQLLNISEVSDSELFSNNKNRVKNREALFTILQKTIEKKEENTLLEAMHTAKIPAGSIRTMQEVFELPEAQQLILEEILPSGQVTRRVRTAVFKREA